MTDVHEPASHPGAAADHLAIPGDRQPWLVWAPANPGGGLSPQLARIILDEYTDTGDIVVDVDDDAVFAATAAQTGRRHHALGGTRRLAVFGHAAGYIDLMLLRWPCDAVHPHWLFFACRALLRNAGVLIVAVIGERDHRIAHLSALTGAASTAGLHVVDHVAVLAPDQSVATPQDGRPRPARRGRRPIRLAVAGVAAAALTSAHTDLLVLTAEATSDE